MQKVGPRGDFLQTRLYRRTLGESKGGVQYSCDNYVLVIIVILVIIGVLVIIHDNYIYIYTNIHIYETY